MSDYHVSVLLKEAIEALQIAPGKKYVDGTLGGGGHTFAMLQRGGEVLSLDVDEDALAFVRTTIEKMDFNKGNSHLAKGNFREIDAIAQREGFVEVAGVVLDLGVSSHQFDDGTRGFSFQTEAELDMRMDQSLTVKAKDLVNGLTTGELSELFTKLGEEPSAKKIAHAIGDYRRLKLIETTKELAELVRKSVRGGDQKIHPATRVFQALRIAVNDELNSLREVLPKAVSLLAPHGRLVVITFHSLEDRIVKHAFVEFESLGKGTIVTKKPIVPTEEEMQKNGRSRSAKLRIFEKI